MTARYFEVHAFTDRLFARNPAGVCLVEEMPADNVMQMIARENNLPATAFVRDCGESFELRWFSPTAQLEICGHGTLASGHVLFEHVGRQDETLTFNSPAGTLKVGRAGRRLVLDFPSRPVVRCEPPPLLIESLGGRPREVFEGGDYLAVFESAEEIVALKPKLAGLAQLPVRGTIVTAPGEDCDFVSRFFAPQRGIAEDPVTGSTHCALVPYWAKRLGKAKLHARQLSARGGELFCEDRGERVAIGGTAVTYVQGMILI